MHHVVTRINQGDGDLCPVEVESVDAGVKLARWFAQESRRVYAVLVESQEQRTVRQLVDFIRARGGKMTARELQRANGRKYPDAALAESALESKVLAGLDGRNHEATLHALRQFERVIKPVRMRGVNTLAVAEFVAKRRAEAGLRPDSTISPATVNKELRHLRGVLRKALKWDYIPEALEFDFLKEPKKLPTYVPPEHFAAIYRACDQAKLPADQPYLAADWWRGLLVLAYMTGWRIGAILALRREDVDLDAGRALSRAKDNKGRRDQYVVLHPLVVEHVCKLTSFGSTVFLWNYRRAIIFVKFAQIQVAAGVKPTGKDHYTFHDLRRGFATTRTA